MRRRHHHHPLALHTTLTLLPSTTTLTTAQVSQHIHSMNMQHVNLFRSTGPEPPAPYERTDVAERTSVQRHAIYLALGASKVLQPVSDRVKTPLPLRNVVEELMRVTGFDQNGVKADAQGLFDLSQAPCLELGATQDGAWKNKKGGGFLLLALKPWSLSIARGLSGRGPPGPGEDPFEGLQSASACIALGWGNGDDSTQNNFE
jgi:hypothetical protein